MAYTSKERKREHDTAYMRVWRANNKDKCWACGQANDRLPRHTCSKCLERARGYNRVRNKKVRLDILTHYGLVCACCGETELTFLTIDHINGGGNEHRRQLGHTHVYDWLRANRYPKGYQTLCFNCNSAKSIQGICPHQQTNKKEE